MKPKILLIGFFPVSCKDMVEHELKELAEMYDIMIGGDTMDCVNALAKAKYQKGTPFRALVFSGDTVILNEKTSDFISRFAQICTDPYRCEVIVMYTDNQYEDVCKVSTFGAELVKSRDWIKVKELLDLRIKKT